jgi:hypothetical protein
MSFSAARPDRWSCSWRSSGQAYDATNTTICLLPESPNPECQCASVATRLTPQEQVGIVAPMALSTVASTCQQGILLGGACRLELTDSPIYNANTLISAGIAADESWACSWNNPTEATLTATVTAICLLPDPLETEPLADRIVHIERTAQLPANNLRLEQAACEPGDFLLWGGCTLSDPDPPIGEAFMFRSGFADPARSDAWQCGWYNPTDLTPTATATAVCLKPPSQ